MSISCWIRSSGIGKKIIFAFSFLVLLLALLPFVSLAENQTAALSGKASVAGENSIAGETSVASETTAAAETSVADETTAAGETAASGGSVPTETGSEQKDGEYVIIPDEPIPAASVEIERKKETSQDGLAPIPDMLPETGGTPGVLFFSFGAVLAAAGLVIKCKERKKSEI